MNLIYIVNHLLVLGVLFGAFALPPLARLFVPLPLAQPLAFWLLVSLTRKGAAPPAPAPALPGRLALDHVVGQVVGNLFVIYESEFL